MDQTELLKQLAATLGKTKVIELSRILKKGKFALRDLIDLRSCLKTTKSVIASDSVAISTYANRLCKVQRLPRYRSQ